MEWTSCAVVYTVSYCLTVSQSLVRSRTVSHGLSQSCMMAKTIKHGHGTGVSFFKVLKIIHGFHGYTRMAQV